MKNNGTYLVYHLEKGTFYFRFPDNTKSREVFYQEEGIRILDEAGDKISDSVFDTLANQLISSERIPSIKNNYVDIKDRVSLMIPPRLIVSAIMTAEQVN